MREMKMFPISNQLTHHERIPVLRCCWSVCLRRKEKLQNIHAQISSLLSNLPYSRLLNIPDEREETSEEREFLTLEELKPHQLQLVELSGQSSNHQNSAPSHQLPDEFQENLHLVPSDQEYNVNVYYDLNQQTNGQCLFVEEGNTIINSDNIMTAGANNFISSNSSMETSNTAALETSNSKSSRKRKFSYSGVSDDDDDAKSFRTTDENKKANHSEIEKRRRDKMNNFISQLSEIIPMCHAMSRKLDKLTVLRMAVQHLKTIRGAVHTYTEGLHKPAFLTDQELKTLILQAAEGFLFVVGCDRGRILYVSESVSDVLKYTQGELLGTSWYDILHHKDVAKIKEQLSSSDLSPRERLIDAKTMLPVKHSDVPQATRLCPGARRSFFCRMKCKSSIQVKEENDSSTSSSGCRRNKKLTDKKFCVIQCTGYLKSWAPAKIGVEGEQESEVEGDCNLSLSCLVAVGRIVDFNNSLLKPYNQKNNAQCSNGTNQPIGNIRNSDPVLHNFQFTSRHAMDGKFLFVDQRATLVLGFLPQELLGTSMYEYFNHKDITALAESHKVALQSSEQVTTHVYGLRTKHSGFIPVQSEWKSFKNPFTKDVEFLVAKNNVILTDSRSLSSDSHANDNYDFFNQSNNGQHGEMQRMINTHIEASKIGRQIAEQVLDYQRRLGDVSSDSSPDPDPTLLQPGIHTTSDNLLNASIDMIEHSSPGNSSSAQSRINGSYANFTTYNNTSRTRSSTVVSPENAVSSGSSVNGGTNDGNDEAAMAVIMSLLEADAGLGGPVDFSNLPWPLP